MSDWVKAAAFATQLEAEMARARLESAEIPASIRSHGAAGIFGPGFQGFVPGGVALYVPADRAADAARFLDGDDDTLPDEDDATDDR